MSKRIENFVNEIKTTEFYKNFVEKICVLPEDEENVYFFAKKNYTAQDFFDVNYIEDRAEVLFVNASLLPNEDRARLQEV